MRLAAPPGVNRVVLAISLARIGEMIGTSMLFVVLPLQVLQLPAVQSPVEAILITGVLTSIYGLVSSLAQPLTGAIADRLQRRKELILVGFSVVSLGTFGLLFTTQVEGLFLLRVIQGLGVALTVPASMAIIVLGTTGSTRGSAMGFYSTMRMVGFTIGPLLGGFLHVRYGLDAALVAAGCCPLLGVLPVLLLVREPSAPGAPDGGAAFQWLDHRLVTRPVIWLAFGTMLMAGAFSMMTTLESEFSHRLQQTALEFGVAFSALTVARMLFQYPLGRWSDVLGRRTIVSAGLLLLGLTTILVGLAQTTVQLVVLRALQGLAAAAIIAPSQALAADLAPPGSEGRQMSVLSTGYGLGIAFGPMLAGLLGVVLFELPFVAMGVLALLVGWGVYRGAPETVLKRGDLQEAVRIR